MYYGIPEYHLAVVIIMFNFVLQYSTREWGCPDTQLSAHKCFWAPVRRNWLWYPDPCTYST